MTVNASELREICASSGSVSEAAQRIGIGERALRKACQRVGLPPPSQLVYGSPMPAGQRLKGNSTLLDRDGQRVNQWVKTERSSDDPPKHDPVPEGAAITRTATLLDGQGAVRAQWITADKERERTWATLRDAIHEVCEDAPRAAAVAPPQVSDCDLLTVIPIGDPHIGMLAWRNETGNDFDLQIAERDLLGAIDLLIGGAPQSASCEIANLGDFFHHESDQQKTPRNGNKLDCDGRYPKVIRTGFRLMRRAIDRALEHFGKVSVVNLCGNHDPTVSLFLAEHLAAVYEHEPRVTVRDNANPFQYSRWGQTLFGFYHGDECKIEGLPGVMAADQASAWGETKEHVWHTGHVHHLSCKEFPGCLVYTWRTMALRDRWHHGMGYRSGQSLTAMHYHREWGLIGSNTVGLRQVRAA